MKETTFKIDKSVELRLPSLPNFLLSKEKNPKTFDIGEFTDDQLRVIGTQWTMGLIEKARERRKFQE